MATRQWKHLPSREVIFSEYATGAAAIGLTFAPGVAFELEAIHVHLSAAPVTSQNFTVTRDAGLGAAYDDVLLKRDLAAEADTDLVWTPDFPLLMASADKVVVAYTNTDTRTYGVEIVGRGY